MSYLIFLNRQLLGLEEFFGDQKVAMELQSLKPLEKECNAIIAETNIVDNGMIVQSAADNLWYYSDEIPANPEKHYLLGKILPYNVKSGKYFSFPKFFKLKSLKRLLHLC